MLTIRIMSLLLVLGSAAPLTLVWGADAGGGISGVVTNAAGKPVAGASIKLRINDPGVTVMVFSQAQGRYRAAGLRPGTYTEIGRAHV